MTTKEDLFHECKRLASDFVLSWSKNDIGEPMVRATCTIAGLLHIIEHTPNRASTKDAECTVMHGLLDSMRLFGAAS